MKPLWSIKNSQTAPALITARAAQCQAPLDEALPFKSAASFAGLCAIMVALACQSAWPLSPAIGGALVIIILLSPDTISGPPFISDTQLEGTPPGVFSV